MSVRPSEPKTRLVGGWPEIAAITAGLVLVLLYFDQAQSPPASFPTGPLLLLIAGLLLAAWGIRGIAGAILSGLGRVLSPWGNRRYRAHVQREAYIYMLILATLCLGALLGRSNMLLLVFGLMAGPFVLGGQITLLVLNRLKALRELPDFAIVGQPFSVRLKLTNSKRGLSAWMVAASDTVESSSTEFHPGVLFTRVPPRGERAAQYTLCAASRGRYRFGPLRVGCAFPLGLVERSFELGQTQDLLVFPRIGQLTEAWRSHFRRGAAPAEQSTARVGVFEEEFQRLREYRGGDTPRSIHWRTTARRNELMVREFEHHRDYELIIVLDLWSPDRPSSVDKQRIELAVSFAATLCAEQAKGGVIPHLQLVICGQALDRVTTPGQFLPIQLLLERLALAEAGPAVDLGEALFEIEVVDSSIRRVLITTRPQSAPASQNGTSGSKAPPLPERAQAFGVIEASPDVLAPYLTFDQRPVEVHA